MADNSAQTLHCTRTGRLVISTRGQINFYDGQRFRYLDPSTENKFPLPLYTGHYHLYFDRYHHMWLKHKTGVVCVNLTTETYEPSVAKVLEGFGIKADEVKDLFFDTDGVAWIVTPKGLYDSESRKTIDVLRPGLNLQELDTNGKRLLLFYENGALDIIDLQTGKVQASSDAYDMKTAAGYTSTALIKEDGTDYYMLRNGNKGGIMLKLSLDTHQWKELLRVPYSLNSLCLKDSILYVPAAYGYWTYNQVSGKLVHYEKNTIENKNGLITDINCMVFDKQGGMWAGTEHRGLLYSPPIPTAFNVFSWTDPKAERYRLAMEQQLKENKTEFKGRRANTVFRDSRGWTWVGTFYGLQLYRSDDANLPVLYTQKEGLKNNIIHSIVEDPLHNIWVATSFGISRLQIDNGKVKYIDTYEKWDKVPNEGFLDGKGALLPDGTIAMQSIDHMVVFDPNYLVSNQLDDEQFTMHPKLIHILINGYNVKTGENVDGNVILEKAIQRTSELKLKYDQNNVTLTFSALNFFRPQQTFYRVRVLGLDDRWQLITPYSASGLVDQKGLLHLPLMGLLPGVYRVQIQASFLPDMWDKTEPYEWVITIYEPWWRSSILYIIIGLFLLTLFGINAYLYVRNLNLKAQRNINERTILKRLRVLAQESEGVARRQAPLAASAKNEDNGMSTEFISVMQKLLPFLSQEKHRLSMRDLSAKAGMEVDKFYSLVNTNVYKNSRALSIALALQQADQLLRTTDKSIGMIAEECGFQSPNFLIASYYRHFGQTPQDLRNQLADKR
ncbi:MAG: helix-turn-helix domain-containing protein [Prevotella sp.]|nr:helix-turn-helix domain-containing protein [Prevotella sp.]